MDSSEISIFKAVVSGVVMVLLLIIFLLCYFVRRQHQYRKWLKQLAAAEVNLRETERSRLAMDLHDDLRQLLTAARLQLMLMPDEGGHAAAACRYVDELNQRLYEIARHLGPRLLILKGLRGALEDLLHSLPAQSMQVELQYRLVQELPLATEIHLYRMVQELLQNTLKHSGANTVNVLVEEGFRVIRLLYRDNGKGFVYPEEHPGLGLHHLRNRAALLDGTMVCRTEPGRGVHFTFELPKPKQDANNTGLHPRGDCR